MIFNFIQLVALQLFIFSIGAFGYKHRFFTKVHTRKFVHVLTGLVAVALPLFLEKEVVGVYALVAIPSLFIAHKRGWMVFIGGGKKVDFGLLLFPFSVLVSVIFFWGESYVPFQFAMLMLAVPDALAGLVGESFKYKVFTITKEKSLSGSTVFFLSSLVGTYFMLKVGLPISFVIALVLTITEAVSGDMVGDNLTVPVVAGLLALQAQAL